jgi:hypothetical protein
VQSFRVEFFLVEGEKKVDYSPEGYFLLSKVSRKKDSREAILHFIFYLSRNNTHITAHSLYHLVIAG